MRAPKWRCTPAIARPRGDCQGGVHLSLRGMAKKRERTPARIEAEQNRLQDLKDQGLFVQVNVRVKTAERMTVLKKLRKRFPDMTDAAIAWLAMEELAAKRNR